MERPACTCKRWDQYVRIGAAYSLGSVFPHLTDKQQAWKDLLALAKHGESSVRESPTRPLLSAFPHLTDKQQAWKDLLALGRDERNLVRRI